MKEDELFGQLVLVNKMITQEQLDEALAIQQQSTEPRMLGNILLAKGYITSRQLRAILELQRRRIPKPATGSQEKKEDITFAFLAVRHKFATPAQVYQCMRQQLRCVKRGLFFRLSEVMLHQGIITQEQLEEITRRQQEKILVCSVCNSRFNTVGLPTGFLFRCKNCSNVLQVPAPK